MYWELGTERSIPVSAESRTSLLPGCTPRDNYPHLLLYGCNNNRRGAIALADNFFPQPLGGKLDTTFLDLEPTKPMFSAVRAELFAIEWQDIDHLKAVERGVVGDDIAGEVS